MGPERTGQRVTFLSSRLKPTELVIQWARIYWEDTPAPAYVPDPDNVLRGLTDQRKNVRIPIFVACQMCYYYDYA